MHNTVILAQSPRGRQGFPAERCRPAAKEEEKLPAPGKKGKIWRKFAISGDPLLQSAGGFGRLLTSCRGPGREAGERGHRERRSCQPAPRETEGAQGGWESPAFLYDLAAVPRKTGGRPQGSASLVPSRKRCVAAPAAQRGEAKCRLDGRLPPNEKRIRLRYRFRIRAAVFSSR